MFPFILLFIMACLILIAIDVVIIWDLKERWLVKKELLETFPQWEGTSKPKKWWIAWSCILFLDLIIFMGFVLIFDRSVAGLIVGLVIIFPITLIAGCLIYLLIKLLVRLLQRK